VVRGDSALKYGSLDSTHEESDWSESRLSDSNSDKAEGTPLIVTDLAATRGSEVFHSFRSTNRDKIYDHDVTLKELHEITIIHVADEHGHIAHYPGEEEDLHHREEVIHKEGGNKRASLLVLSTLSSCVDTLKCVFSMAFLLASMYACTAAVITQQTVGTEDMSAMGRAIVVAVFWILILWLAEMEGSQNCLVGLQPIPKTLFRHTHPHAYRSTCLAHQGDNMERFIVGRQFLIVLVVFVTNMIAFPVPGVSLFGLNDHLTNVLLGSGIAVTADAVMLGQVAQINAANCMLDFINTFFGLFTTYVSLFFDATGLLHSVYLVQIVFAKITGTPIESSEPPRGFLQSIFFWTRVIFSCVTLGYFCALTLSAVYHDETTMWPGVPDSASVLALIILLIFVGLLEGMQIALFAVVNLPSDETNKHPWAARCCELTFSGSNLQAFLIGRQMCVTLGMFVVARITSCNVDVEAGEATIFGVSDGVQRFFNTGLPGAVITTVIGSLAWRIIASSFPVAFLENPIIYGIIRLCLVVEASGVCSATWMLALIQKKIMGYQLDELYIGTPEERVAAAELNNDKAITREAVIDV